MEAHIVAFFARCEIACRRFFHNLDVIICWLVSPEVGVYRISRKKTCSTNKYEQILQRSKVQAKPCGFLLDLRCRSKETKLPLACLIWRVEKQCIAVLLRFIKIPEFLDSSEMLLEWKWCINQTSQAVFSMTLVTTECIMEVLKLLVP
jgi:hypothetical protein